jgi:protocatechuate 3,4-dioxygenase, alpha subunit
MAALGETPSQTVGPYFSMRLCAEGENILYGPGVPGERIRIEGKVLDGDGDQVEDALLEAWQANAAGRYRHPVDTRDNVAIDDAFTGFGRAGTDFETGLYWFETVKPGPVPDPEGEMQAPHISLTVQARGTLDPYFTRIYFSDEIEANNHDMVLTMVPKDRRSTLVARLVDGSDPKTYRFDIRLQGPDETVFFDF